MGDGPTYETPTMRVWHLQTGSTSSGQVHEQRVEYLPRSPFPPMHHHPAQDEHFDVEQGAMLFEVDGVRRVVEAGESIDVAPDTPHRARNASSTESAVVRWETRPALRTTEFFLTAAALGGSPHVLDRALLVHSFRDVFRLDGPERLVLPFLAGVARARGRRLPR